MGTAKKGLWPHRKKQGAAPETAPAENQFKAYGPDGQPQTAAEANGAAPSAMATDAPAAAAGTEAAPAQKAAKAKKPRRWALHRRRRPEPPAPTPPPVLQVCPFDKRDYRTLSLLLGGFKTAVGEPPLTQKQWAQLRLAIEEERITYYIAYFHGQPVGLCSLCLTYSDYLCAPSGVFEDFFVRPEARGQGIARALVQQACTEVRQRGGSSLTVACAPCDLAMYQALGFQEELGVSLCRPL